MFKDEKGCSTIKGHDLYFIFTTLHFWVFFVFLHFDKLDIMFILSCRRVLNSHWKTDKIKIFKKIGNKKIKYYTYTIKSTGNSLEIKKSGGYAFKATACEPSLHKNSPRHSPWWRGWSGSVCRLVKVLIRGRQMDFYQVLRDVSLPGSSLFLKFDEYPKSSFQLLTWVRMSRRRRLPNDGGILSAGPERSKGVEPIRIDFSPLTYET